MSHKFVGSSASASTTHEHSALNSVSAQENAFRTHRYNTCQTPPCARLYALVHCHIGCAHWDLTHRLRFIKAVFITLGNTQNLKLRQLFTILRFFVPRSTEYLCSTLFPGPSILRVISIWIYLRMGFTIYIIGLSLFACVFVCVCVSDVRK